MRRGRGRGEGDEESGGGTGRVRRDLTREEREQGGRGERTENLKSFDIDCFQQKRYEIPCTRRHGIQHFRITVYLRGIEIISA